MFDHFVREHKANDSLPRVQFVAITEDCVDAVLTFVSSFIMSSHQVEFLCAMI